VNSEGTVTLSGLPAHKEVAIVVMYPEPFDFQEEMKRWMDDIRQRYPYAKMNKEEVLKRLRQTREMVYGIVWWYLFRGPNQTLKVSKTLLYRRLCKVK
jgi:hypothetical protein